MKSTRRSFLLLAGGTAALAAAAAATKTVTSLPDTASAKAKPVSAGYELTAHIRNYYRTASI
jgi:hypothetical protein